MKVIKIGLKANAHFLFSLMNGKTLGGTTGGIEHRAIVHLSEPQFDDFKHKIFVLGYNVSESLCVVKNADYDFSCYLVK